MYYACIACLFLHFAFVFRIRRPTTANRRGGVAKPKVSRREFARRASRRVALRRAAASPTALLGRVITLTHSRKFVNTLREEGAVMGAWIPSQDCRRALARVSTSPFFMVP
jgi:hypothetical protein